MTRIRILTADHVLPITSDPIQDGAVAIKGSRIAAVGTRNEVAEQFPGHELTELGEVASDALTGTGTTALPDEAGEMARTTMADKLPDLDVLQIETPGTFTHASAGADGTGADGSRQACSLNPACVVGPDGTIVGWRGDNLDRLSYVSLSTAEQARARTRAAAY